jgi:ActR/RegA family two-component response regulator
MRPKKPILLYCADRELLSTIAFALRLRPYRVTATEDSMEASLAVADRCAAFDCVVLIHAQQGDLAGRLIYRILERATEMPLLLVDRAGDLAPVRYADMVLYGRNTTMAHILSALQILCRRRTGPSPRSAA